MALTPSYTEMINDVDDLGTEVVSRYGDTKEIVGLQVEFTAGTMTRRRGLNNAIGFMELMQILAGVFDPEAIARVAPRANLELFTAKMAYGPRLVAQIPKAITTLRRDPESRQAIMFVGRPEDGMTPDQPCTTSIQFLLRDGFMQTVVSMRSWDLLKGLPYDVICFGGLAMAVARCLGVVAEYVTVTAGSAHVYADDVAAGKRPSQETDSFSFDEEIVPDGWSGIQYWAFEEIKKMTKVPEGIEIWEGW